MWTGVNPMVADEMLGDAHFVRNKYMNQWHADPDIHRDR